MKIRPVFAETIDKTYPWGCFDVSAAGVPNSCGAGGMLYIYDKHFFPLKLV